MGSVLREYQSAALDEFKAIKAAKSVDNVDDDDGSGDDVGAAVGNKGEGRDMHHLLAKSAKSDNTIVQLPAGSGKTQVACAAAIDELQTTPDASVLILVHQEAHIGNWVQHLLNIAKATALGSVSIFKIKANPSIQDVAKWTTARHARVYIGCGHHLHSLKRSATISHVYARKWTLVIGDEAHVWAADTAFGSLLDLKKERVLLLTATLMREDDGVKGRLLELCPHVIRTIGLGALVQMSVLPPVFNHYIPFPQDDTLAIRLSALSQLVKSIVVDHGDKVMVIVHHINHQRLVASHLFKNKELPVFPAYNMNEDDKVLDEFANTETPSVLVGGYKLRTGHNVCDPFSTIIFWPEVPEKSRAGFLQLLGRLHRGDPKKTKRAYCFSDNSIEQEERYTYLMTAAVEEGYTPATIATWNALRPTYKGDDVLTIRPSVGEPTTTPLVHFCPVADGRTMKKTAKAFGMKHGTHM